MTRILAFLFVFAVGIYQLVQTIVERELVWAVVFAVALPLLAAHIAREVRKVKRASRN
ncbi:MAG TPA: hypothetical protein VES97_12300 [Solirubrobacteraceae bacterium]|nr:hypothetical protein [Solirubrobacteraceae bacterium]